MDGYPTSGVVAVPVVVVVFVVVVAVDNLPSKIFGFCLSPENSLGWYRLDFYAKKSPKIAKN